MVEEIHHKSKSDIYTNGQYLRNNPTWHVEVSPWKAGQIMKMIDRNHLAPRTVCEVGCGAGEILNQLSMSLPENVSFYGYEISPQAYELAKNKQNNRLQFYYKDLTKEDGSFYDLLLVIDVLEHVSDYFGFLKSIKSRSDLKIFHIPLDIAVQKILLGGLMKRRKSLGHIHYFTKETALAGLEENDYKIIDYYYTSQAMDLPMASFRYKIAKYIFKAGDFIVSSIINKDMSVNILGGHSLMVLAK